MTNFYEFSLDTHDVYQKDGIEFVRKKDSDTYLIYTVERPGYFTEIKTSQLESAKEILAELAWDLDAWME